jgi:hypothetical protein
MRHQGALPGQEQAVTVTAEALDCEETRAFVDLCLDLAETVDPAREVPCIRLTVLITPAAGAPRADTYARAYLTAETSSAADGAKTSLSFECYGLE